MATAVAQCLPSVSIDWDRPWLAPLAPLRRALDADVRAEFTRMAQERNLASGQGAALSFEGADDAGDFAYELHIARTGRVPTRANPHDLFNAAMWLTFPRTKAVLNARQAQCIADGRQAGRQAGRRGSVRDAATLFDESGLIVAVGVVGARELSERITAHDWEYLFQERRQQWQRDWVPWLFGHAVMEKLVRPYAAITVRVKVVAIGHGDPHDVTAVDAATAAAFARENSWSPSALPPIPVLGIPGWWRANESPQFYRDRGVFRPQRAPEPAEA